ncbi:hypothetical protein HAQ01_04990 [Acidithiobacillus thiooxidans]|uniref:Uncharacterized protein n=1 Tax=Acidithiobacillus sulfurivorans TaxID=1958756 RepID=A0ABS5ZV69_9PROT|nr:MULTISPECIES: hypothetical protein [Acidithiobacillus]MBU2759054.1 hypothetical protein [Acidithiobacillus sulfurivorans]MBU2792749.1 hypothetical protein [Acidithiobacillus thiooxidans]
MNRSSLLPTQPVPVITRQAPAAVVRPATSEQALEMLHLMMADVIAQSKSIMAGWAERAPLDDQDAARSAVAAQAAQDRLSHLTQSYAKHHGKLDVPLISLGSNYDIMRAALRPVMAQIAKGQEQVATTIIAEAL